MKAKSARSKAARPQQLQDVLSLKKTLLFVAIASVLGSQAAMAGPEGGQIVNGVGSIVQTDPSSTLVTQGSDRLGIDWQSFNVAEHESVRFDQPSSSAIALNRIFDQNPSLILGALDANGHVFLINPNGMVFGEGAQINVAGLVASSLDLSQEDFAAGNFNFAGDDSSGIIVNRGLIQAATGGSVTLLGGGVANEGVIVAELGQVNLGAGTRASLDFTGDGLLFFEVDGALLANNTGADAAVSNSGTIQANGGSVLLTAAAARGVFSNVVNNSGLVSATRIENHGGVIRLVGDGGDVMTSGTLDASGQGGAGGTVQVLGDRVGLTGSAVVDVSGDTDGGSVQIGGGFQGSDPNVKNAEATFVGAGTRIDASAGGVGNGGEVIVWADGITRFNGEIDARGGAIQGDGGFVEVSGKETLLYRGRVDASAASGTGGTLLLDPLSITIKGGADPDPDAPLDDGQVLFEDDPDDAAYTIYEKSLEAIDVGTIRLEATESITATGLFDNPATVEDVDQPYEGDGVVLLGSNVNLEMSTRNGDGVCPDDVCGDGPGSINLVGDSAADPLTFQTRGSGTITMEAGDPSGDGDPLGNHPASLVVGNLLTAGGAITLSARNDVTVNNVDAGTGVVDITVGTDGVSGRTLSIGGKVEGDATGSLLKGGGSTGHILVAGGGVDAIVIDAENTLNLIPFQDFGDVSGGGGVDTFTINVSDTGTLRGGAGNDKFSLGGNVAATVDGEAGSDELIASTAGTLFTLTNTNAGTAAQRVAPPLPETTQTVNFTSVENLTGNTGADRFVLGFDLGDPTELTPILGAAKGNDGDDEFALDASQTGTLKGGAGNDKFSLGGNVAATVDGEAGSDELIASTAGTLFTLTNTNAGTAAQRVAPPLPETTQTVNFTSVENLTGNTGADRFVLGFDLGDPTELTPILGAAKGNDGDDEFALDASQTGTLKGGAGNDKFSLGGNVAATVDGEAGSDELIASTAGTLFTLTNTNAGTAAQRVAPPLPETTQTVNFTSVENLTGNTGADRFVLGFDLGDTSESILGAALGNDGADEFAIKANQSGTIKGGNDGDKFTIDGDVTATVKGDAGSDELIATAATVFDLSATNAGTAILRTPGAQTVNFESVENLTGSAGADQFVLDFNLGDTGESILGAALGNDGADEFTIKANQSGTVKGGDGGDKFTIDGNVTATVKGDAGSDELIATAATVFDLSSTNAGTAVLKAPGAGTVNFESVENLTGSAGADQFVLDFNLGDSTELTPILGRASGNDGADEFAIAGNQAGIFDGGEGSDTFTLAANAVLTNAGAAVDGGDDALGGDIDKLDLVANATPGLTISLTSSVVKEGFSGSAATVFTGGFAAIDNIAGSADTLQGRNVVSTWTQDTYSDGTESLKFTGIATAAGGTATDALLGGAGVDVFTVAAAGSVALNTQAFTGIETVSGQGDADVFNLNADFGGAVFGDGAADAFADKFFVNASQTGALDGGAGDDVFTLGGDVAATLHGGLGSDRLVASAVGTGTAFASAAATGTARVIGSTLVANFDAIENLTGNVGNDTFAISGNQTGVFDGGEGSDTFTLAANAVLSNAGAAVDGGDDAAGDDSDKLDLAANATALTISLTNSVANEGFSGSATTVFTGGGSFAAIDDIVGSADTLQGRNVASTWTQNTYSDGAEALTFSGITTAAGGTATDTLLGGAGVDVFTVAAAGGVTLNNLQNFTGIDTLHGLGGADQFNLNADFGGAVFGDGVADAFADKFLVNASQTGALDGGAGDDVFTLGGDVAAANLHGGLGIDRLEASAAGTGTAFASAAATGTARVIGSTLVANFDAIENLTGNTGGDTFAISGNQTGVFDGGEGSDTFTLAGNAVLSNAGAAVDGGDDAAGDDSDKLDLSANATALPISLTNSVANEGFSGSATTVFTGGGFAAVDNIAGSADTLQGRNVASTWTQDTYSDGIESLTFSGITTAAGGTATDTLLGGAGIDVFTVAAAGSVTLNTQGFTGIETLFGLGGADRFDLNANFGGAVNGDGGTDAFNVNATQAGVLDGGEDSDTFTVAAAATLPGAGVRLTGGVDATGNDVDTLNVAANATALTISLTNSVANEGFSGSATTVFTGGGSFAAIDDIVGSADTLQGRNVASTWTQNTYSDGAEALTFSGITTAAGGTATDTLLGGAGVDVFTVAAAGSVTLNTQGFTGIETLFGLGGADRFDLNANFGGAVNGDGGTDAFNVNATQAGVLDGGEDSDTFTVAAAATLPGAGVRLTGGVDATGNDVDTLNVAANATALTISLTNSVANEGFSGSATTVFTGGGSFAAIDDIVGSADTLQGRNVASTWTQNTYSDGAEALTFSGITTAAGGTAADELRGNNLDDLFTVTAAGSVTLNTQGFTGIETLSGLGGADDFHLNANFGGAINGDAGTDEFFVDATQTGQLAGGDGDDDFRLGGNFGANIQGGNDGPSGDEIIASASATTFTLSATGGTAQVIFAGTQTANFQGVENLTGNTGNDEFNLNFSLSGTASGGGGDDRFNLAAAVSAKVAGDAGADSLFGAATTTKFNLAGNNAGSLTNGTGTVSFATLESLTGGAAADEFVLNTGTHNGNLVLVGGGGSDTADVRGSFTVTGNLTLNGIETITDNSGGTTLGAVTLTIAGATAVGESGKVLWTNVDNVDIQSSGPVFLTEKDGLTILHLDAASFYVTVLKNGLRLRLAEADGEGRFDVLGGDIVDINGDEVNMVASHALLSAPEGTVGTAQDKLDVRVPSGAFIDVQTKSRRASDAFIAASKGSHLRVAGREFIIGAGATTAEALLTNNTLLVDISGIDWASLDPTVTLLDCLEPCVRLPEDQAEDEELARIQAPTKLLLIRTSHGWKMIPVVVAAETAALRE